MNSAFAAAHSADAGQPPDRHKRMAQSIGYALAGVVNVKNEAKVDASSVVMRTGAVDMGGSVSLNS